ncbi:hypothetical protein CRUP_015483 [Coryphaenoides rupestris]|nr:hypothetical protein CRUP_015483 [Coryphaenoides rupestris]
MTCEASGRSFRASLAAALQRLSAEVQLLTERLSGEVLLLTDRLSAAQRAENQALRRRCVSLELQLRAAREEAHGGGGGGGYPPDLHLHHAGGAGGVGGGGPGKCVQEQQQQQQHPPTIEGIFGKDWCSDLWREEQGGPERKERLEALAPAPSEPQGPPPINLLDSDPDLIFVKEEAYEDQPIGQQMRARDHRKSVPAFQESSLHRNVANELRLQPRDLHNFPLSGSSQTQPQPQPQPQQQQQQQGSQSAVPLIEHLIEDSGLSTFVDDANPSQATAGEYSDCMNNAHLHHNNNSGSSNASKHLAADQRGRDALKTSPDWTEI